MSVDLASLALRIDSSEVKSGAAELDKLTAAGKRTEAATGAAGKEWVKASSAAGKLRNEEAAAAMAAENMAKSTSKAGVAASQMAKQAQQAASATRNLQFQTRNLTYQLTDVAQGWAMGLSPMQLFMQQGGQIVGVIQSTEGGLGALAGQLGRTAAAYGPVIIAAGAMAAAIGLTTAEINKNAEVTVTWQDTLLGAFDAIKSAIESRLVSAFEYFGISTADVWGKVVDATKQAINIMVGVTSLAPRLMVTAFQTLPGAIADVFFSAANVAIRAINGMVQKAVAILNGFIASANGILGKVGLTLPTLTAPQIGEVANSYAGAGRKAGMAFAGTMLDTINRDFIGEGAAFVSPFAQDRARRRIEDDAEKAGSAGGKKMGRAMAEKAAKEVEDTFGIELTKAVEKLTKDFAKSLGDGIEDILEDISRTHTIDLELRIRNQENIARTISNNLTGLAGIFGGSAGRLASSILDMETVLSDGTTEKLADQFGRELAEIFGADGTKFANLLGTVIAGAGIGNLAGNTILGSSGSSLGSTIGGALGAAAGKEFLSKALGSFAGPVGGIVGGVLGGLVGGMFKKTKKASATISGSGINITGNSSSREAAAGQLAGSVTDAINEIAEALGADIDMALGKVSVGIRKKSLRVDTTGAGRTKGAGVLDFGQDQEAALKAAIADLISDGVLKGISAGMQKLLKGGDIEKQLEKALKFKGVFDELEQRTDPLAYDLKLLGKEFDELTAIFAEAGATTEEYAKLEELRALRIKEIQDQYAIEADALELLNEKRQLEAEIMRLQGNATGALTLLRQLELEAMDATLRPLQEQIYALQDAAAKRELEIQLMEALGLAQEAEAARRAEYLKTIPDSLHALQQQIWAAQDATKATEAYSTALSDARSQLTAAYNREQSALQQTADKFRGFADSLREFRNSLYGADSGMATLRSMTVALMKTGGLAASGNADAMAALPGVGRDYLSVAKGSAATAQDYARAVALVAGYTDKAIASASGKASSAEAQMAILTKQYEALAGIEEEQVSFTEAMQRVKELLENPVVPLEPTPVALPEDYVSASNDQQQAQLDALNNINRDQNRRLDEQSMQLERLARSSEGMATNMATMSAVIKRVERQGRLATVEEA